MKRYALVFLKAGVIAPRSEESDGSRLCRKAWAQGPVLKKSHAECLCQAISCRTSLSHSGYQCSANGTAAGLLQRQPEIAVPLGSRNRFFFFLIGTIVYQVVPTQLDYHCIDIKISGQGRVSAKSTSFYLRSICQQNSARSPVLRDWCCGTSKRSALHILSTLVVVIPHEI